jgi:hypothetical protein
MDIVNAHPWEVSYGALNSRVSTIALYLYQTPLLGLTLLVSSEGFSFLTLINLQFEKPFTGIL